MFFILLEFLDSQLTLQKIAPFFEENDFYSPQGLLQVAQRFKFTSLTIINMLTDCNLLSIELPVLALLSVISKFCSVNSEQIYKRSSMLGCIVSLLQLNALNILYYLTTVYVLS